MANDKGHASNVAHLQELITHIQTFGAAYNPKNTALQISELQTQLQDSIQVLQDMNSATADYKIAVDNRKTAFAELNPLISRSLNALKVSGASKENYETAAAMARKTIGSKQKKATDETNVSANTAPAPTHSTAQQSYDNRLANFAAYLTVIEGIAEYDPNEADLKMSALQELAQNLNTASQTVITAEAELSAKRGNRNNVLYGKENSMVEVGQMVKDYIKSVFGANSSEYKQISKLTFVNYN